MVTKKDIIKILKTIDDPEIMMDVYSLGLIYDINIVKDTVKIKMTFTTPMCPYGPMLLEMVENAIKDKIKDVKEVKIEVVFEPPWEPSEELRAMFGV